MSDDETMQRQAAAPALTPKTEPNLLEAGSGDESDAEAPLPVGDWRDDVAANDQEGAVAADKPGEPRATSPADDHPHEPETDHSGVRTRAQGPALSEDEIREKFQNVGTISHSHGTGRPVGRPPKCKSVYFEEASMARYDDDLPRAQSRRMELMQRQIDAQAQELDGWQRDLKSRTHAYDAEVESLMDELVYTPRLRTLNVSLARTRGRHTAPDAIAPSGIVTNASKQLVIETKR